MTNPAIRPKRKNPVLATRRMALPPWARSRVALGLTAAAAEGRFELQVCMRCGATQYPPREICHRVLSDALEWRDQDGGGQLIAQTQLRHSHDVYFRERLPWRLGMVRLDAGPTVVVHLHGDVAAPPARVRVGARLDKAGMAVLVGFPEKDVSNMADDRQLREMTCDPKFRKVLVTDGKTAVGQALVKALVAAGADIVWVGHAEPWKKYAGFDELAALPQITLLPLDLTDARSVKQAAAEIGGKVDIVVNNAEYHRANGIASRPVPTQRAPRWTSTTLACSGSRRTSVRSCAREGPTASRAPSPGSTCCRCLRSRISRHTARTRHRRRRRTRCRNACDRRCALAGIRVINVFPGPIDDEWNQTLPPPKLAPAALARAVVAALRDGVEDVYPGDVAQEWRRRWPKVRRCSNAS